MTALATTPALALSLTGLRKRFGDVEAVAGVSLEIPSTGVFGLLGPNGAGKTTIIRLVCGLLRPDAGSIHLLGRRLDRRWAAASIGLCPQDLVIWDGLTLAEQLRYAAAIHDVPADTARERIPRLLAQLGLEDKGDRLASSLSGGMKRRLNIALALVHEPRILVLDEPQAGLDPQSRLLVREFVRTMALTRTVILTTHDMEEADKLSSRLAIVDHGKVLAEGTPEALKAGGGRRDVVELRVDAADIPSEVLSSHEWSASFADGTIRALAPDAMTCAAELRGRLADRGIAAGDVRIRRVSLEDVFIGLTGRGLRE